MSGQRGDAGDAEETHRDCRVDKKTGDSRTELETCHVETEHLPFRMIFFSRLSLWHDQKKPRRYRETSSISTYPQLDSSRPMQSSLSSEYFSATSMANIDLKSSRLNLFHTLKEPFVYAEVPPISQAKEKESAWRAQLYPWYTGK